MASDRDGTGVAAERARFPVSVAAVYALAVLLAVAYALFFSWLSIQRYNAFLMHALDMGNLDQAVWNTLHGKLFFFTNMQQPLAKEAYGTTTRLSFHVEPILLPLSLLYLLHAGPETLIITQASLVALGAPAAARLALRATNSTVLAGSAAAAYLLFPALEAATLYEFHPVALAAPALLWAIVFAEERRYVPYALCCLVALACKEEIGLVVAMLSLWLVWRGGDRRLGVAIAALSAAWSLLTVGIIVPHFAQGASAYWQRYINASAADSRTSSGLRGVIAYWLQHPHEFVRTLLSYPKWSMLHRLLVASGYLALFGLPLLAAGLPSLGILMLTTDQHMYGGLGHYSAELVPINVGAAILGAAWLARQARRLGLPGHSVPAACGLWLLALALLNGRANGFTPLARDYAAPVITAHDLLGQRLLARIPPGVPVSSMDQLNPHLGDRPDSYLFPEIANAQYVALDITTGANPSTAAEQHQEAMRLLASRHWEILAAQDGYLILHHVDRALAATPTLPPAFFSFMLPAARPGQPAVARFGDALDLVGVQVLRREQVNLRVPDVILVTTWRVLRPLPADLGLRIQIADTHGQLVNHFEDQAAIDWLPPDHWPVGGLVRIASQQISIVVLDPGSIGIRVSIYQAGRSGQIARFSPRLMGDEQRPGLAVDGTRLQVALVPVTL